MDVPLRMDRKVLQLLENAAVLGAPTTLMFVCLSFAEHPLSAEGKGSQTRRGLPKWQDAAAGLPTEADVRARLIREAAELRERPYSVQYLNPDRHIQVRGVEGMA